MGLARCPSAARNENPEYSAGIFSTPTKGDLWCMRGRPAANHHNSSSWIEVELPPSSYRPAGRIERSCKGLPTYEAEGHCCETPNTSDPSSSESIVKKWLESCVHCLETGQQKALTSQASFPLVLRVPFCPIPPFFFSPLETIVQQCSSSCQTLLTASTSNFTFRPSALKSHAHLPKTTSLLVKSWRTSHSPLFRLFLIPLVDVSDLLFNPIPTWPRLLHSHSLPYIPSECFHFLSILLSSHLSSFVGWDATSLFVPCSWRRGTLPSMFGIPLSWLSSSFLRFSTLSLLALALVPTVDFFQHVLLFVLLINDNDNDTQRSPSNCR